MQIGAGYDPSSPLAGLELGGLAGGNLSSCLVADVIGYNVMLSDFQRTMVEGYYAQVGTLMATVYLID